MSEQRPEVPEQQRHPQQPAPRQNPFERLFPGPSPDDPRMAQRLEQIQRAAEQRAQRLAQHEQRQRQRQRQRQDGQQSDAVVEPAQPAVDLATSDDVTQLRDALHEQTDVIRALLDANVSIRDDARSTAQNSRTLAIAGIVIAFFTLVAAVVTVFVAVQAG